MKKILFGLCALVLTNTAFAHTLKPLKTLTHPAMNALNRVAEKIESEYPKTHAIALYKITKIKPAAREGESLVDTYIRVLKFTLHRDYPITGDDGGYSFGELNADMSKDDIETALEYVDITLTKAVQNALKAGLIVVVGDGAGNNTSASILGVFDPKTEEMFYFIHSNFGSDS